MPLWHFEALPRGLPGARRTVKLTVQTDVSRPPSGRASTTDEFAAAEVSARLPSTLPEQCAHLRRVCPPFARQAEGSRCLRRRERGSPRRLHHRQPRRGGNAALLKLPQPPRTARRSSPGGPSRRPFWVPGAADFAACGAAACGRSGAGAAGPVHVLAGVVGQWESGRGKPRWRPRPRSFACDCTCVRACI